MDNTQLVEKLKNLGMRVTPQRLAISRYMDGRTDHPTAQQVLAALKPEYPSLSLTTVYDTLNSLVSAGAISRLADVAGVGARYDGDPTPHVNIICSTCGAVLDHDSPRAEELQKEVEKVIGGRVRTGHVVFEVECAHGVDPESCPLRKARKSREHND